MQKSTVPLMATLVILAGCSDTVFLQPPHAWEFNSPVRRDLGSTSNQAPDAFYSDGNTAARPLLSPLYPQFTGSSPTVNNTVLGVLHRSQCLWVPDAQELRLSWEVTAEAFSPDLGTNVNIGLCTATHPITRDPIRDSDGDVVVTSPSQVLTPQNRIELSQCNPSAAPTGFNTCQAQTSVCSLLPNTCEAAGNPAGAPFCQIDCALTPTLSSTYTVRVVDTSRPGSSLGGFAIEAGKTFDPTIKVVEVSTTLARPLQPWTLDINPISNPLPPTSRVLIWRVPSNAGGVWEDNFTPDLTVSRVRVFEFDPATDTRHYLTIEGLALGIFNTCPGGVVDRITCPQLAFMTPTYHKNGPDQAIDWIVQVPITNSGRAPLIEFTIVNGTKSSGLVASPPFVDFRSVYGGRRHLFSGVAALQNLGGASVVVNQLRIGGQDAPYFEVAGPAQPFTIGPLGTQLVDLAVTPQSAILDLGAKQGELIVATNQPAPFDEVRIPLAASITGPIEGVPTTVQLCLDPSGTVPSCSPSRNFLIQNSTAIPITVTSVAAVNDPLSTLALNAIQGNSMVALQLPFDLQPGESRVLRVTHTGADPELSSAEVVVDSSSGQARVTVIARALSVQPLEPDISLAPPNINFGVLVAGTTRARPLEVRNEGTADLTVSGLVLGGPNAAQFAVTTTTPLTVAPGTTTAIPIEYRPPAGVSSPYSATLTLASNDPDEASAVVTLFGHSAVSNLLVQPTSLAFNPSTLAPTLPPGLGSTRGFNVYNTGSASLTVTGASLRVIDGTGNPSPHYTLRDDNGPIAQPAADRVIAPGAVLPLNVMFRPTTLGPHPATIELQSTAPGGAVTVTITGEGIN